MQTTIDYKEEAAFSVAVLFLFIALVLFLAEPWLVLFESGAQFIKEHIVNIRVVVYPLALVPPILLAIPLVIAIHKREYIETIGYFFLIHFAYHLISKEDHLILFLQEVIPQLLRWLFGAV